MEIIKTKNNRGNYDNLSVFKVSMIKYNSFIGEKLFHARIKDFLNNKYPH